MQRGYNKIEKAEVNSVHEIPIQTVDIEKSLLVYSYKVHGSYEGFSSDNYIDVSLSQNKITVTSVSSGGVDIHLNWQVIEFY